MTWAIRTATLLLGMLVMSLGGLALGVLWTGGEFVAGRADLVRISALIDSTFTGRLVGTAVLGAAMLLALAAVVISWVSRSGLISVSSSGHAPMLVPTDAIAHHVADAALATEYVESARASVTPDGNGSVAIALNLGIDEDAEAGSVVSAVDRHVASALEARYGIQLAHKPNVDVHHVAGRGHGRRRTEVEPSSDEVATIDRT